MTTEKLLARSHTLFLRGVIVLMALAVLALCVFGIPAIVRGAAAEWPEIAPFERPVLYGLYATAIPFFLALYQGLRLLRYIDRNVAFSRASIQALRIIKYCALAMTGLYLMGMPVVFLVAQLDDAPGLVLFGLVAALSPTVIAVFAAVLQKLLQSGMDLKAENDLTV